MKNPFALWKNRRPGGLLENTLMLFIMQFTTIFLGLITTRFQYQRLGEENVGVLAIAVTIMNFIQLFMDFGFIQSATGKIAKHRDDRAYVSKVFTCVTVLKVIFALLSAVAVGMTLLVMTKTNKLSGSRSDLLTYWLYLLATVTNSFFGDFLYKGMERMSAITYRTVSIKIFSVLMIYFFMQEPHHYYMVPLFTALGNIVAIALVYRHMRTKLRIWFVRVTRRDVLDEMKHSAHFFLSRIATTVYNQMNVLILGFANDSAAVSGYYRTADSVINAAKVGIVSPISDSLYPHMMRRRDFSLIKKTLKYGLPVLLVGCGVVYWSAPWICSIWLDTPEAVPGVVMALRGLMPTVVIALPNYLLGFPTLGAMGLSKQVNNSTIFGTVVHIVMLLMLGFSGHMTLQGLCMLTCLTEALVLCYRVIVIFRNRRLLRPQEPEAALEQPRTPQ